MSGLPGMSGIVSDDFAKFQQTPPDVASAAKKKKEQETAMKKRDEQILKKEREEGLNRLVSLTKQEDAKASEEQLIAERASAMRKIASYMKAFPEKLKGLAMTPARLQKASLEELQMHIADIEHELGKENSEELLTFGVLMGAQQIERLHHIFNPLKLNLNNFDKVVSANMESKFKPLITQFCIKYQDSMSHSLFVRSIAAVAVCIYTTHNLNTHAQQVYKEKAEQTKADAELKAAVNKI